jgi:hypothetical protein
VSEAATPPDPEIGEETAVERVLNRYLGHAAHRLLSRLGFLGLVAAGMATSTMLAHDFPKLWQPSDEYSSLQLLLQHILLMAIAAGLGLLLFHRTSAAVEVVMFVIARKMVQPTISALELLLGAVGLATLMVVRFYYLPGRPR